MPHIIFRITVLSSSTVTSPANPANSSIDKSPIADDTVGSGCIFFPEAVAGVPFAMTMSPTTALVAVPVDACMLRGCVWLPGSLGLDGLITVQRYCPAEQFPDRSPSRCVILTLSCISILYTSPLESASLLGLMNRNSMFV